MTEYPEYNPLDEMEDLPPLTELEEQQEWNQELLVKIKRAKKQLDYCVDLAENGTNELLKINLKKISFGKIRFYFFYWL